jgi:hypothetical protein
MAYQIVDRFQDGFVPRRGLEGPFRYPNGRVLYYDPRAGQYWDPRTDFYVPPEDVADLQQSIFRLVSAH